MDRIAVIYADPKGFYAGREGVDLWDEKRDARNYWGPWPVVAHPPCTRWCRLAGFVQARYGYKIGDDGGTFEHALTIVRWFGGVLEHPAYSKAWEAYGLPKPDRRGGWVGDRHGGFACHVEQGQYGHPAKKATWLYAMGCELPELRWGSKQGAAVFSSLRAKERGETRHEITKKQRSATPPEFGEILLAMAWSVEK